MRALQCREKTLPALIRSNWQFYFSVSVLDQSVPLQGIIYPGLWVVNYSTQSAYQGPLGYKRKCLKIFFQNKIYSISIY